MTELPRPMTTSIVLYVKDIDRVAAFYVATLGLSPWERADDFAVLRGDGVELSLVRVPEAIAATIRIDVPPQLREDTPIKPSFAVPSLERVQAAARAAGGDTKAPAAAWRWRGELHLDGHDPEGNVVQFRQAAP